MRKNYFVLSQLFRRSHLCGVACALHGRLAKLLTPIYRESIMPGIIFIVNIPKKEYENELRNKKIPNLIIEKETNEKASKVINELKNEFKKKHSEPDNPQMCVQDEDGNIVIKCRSIDSLNERKDSNSDSYRRSSETIQADSIVDGRKTYAWDDIMQILKPKKKKLTISKKVRPVDVLEAFRDDTPLETILSEIVSRLDIKNAAWNTTKGDKFWQVTFSLQTGSLSEELLQVLKTFGIGSRYESSVSLLPCALYFKSNDRIPTTTELENAERESGTDTAWSLFSSSVRSRNHLAQILRDVRARGALTFDWVFMLLVAAFVAAIGLIENSTAILVASMLISPLLAPITAGTLGTAVRDRSLQLMGLKNEFLGLFMALVMGFVVGLTICAIDEQYGVVEKWPTHEMLVRCRARSVWVGVLVAIPSGVGCALAVAGEFAASLVGVAISAALLPPAVNAGLLWSMAATRIFMNSENQRWSVVDPRELALMGSVSLCLTFVNIVFVFLAGVAVYKLKEIGPLERRDISWWGTNKERSNSKQNNDDSLDWDAYNNWCNSSMKNNDEDNKDETEHSNNCTFRRKPTLLRNLRAQNLAQCHKLQLEDDLKPVTQDIIDQKPNTETNETQNTEENNQNESKMAPKIEDVKHSYNNLGYEHDTSESESPTLDISSSFTVGHKKLRNNNKTLMFK